MVGKMVKPHGNSIACLDHPLAASTIQDRDHMHACSKFIVINAIIPFSIS